MVRGGKENKRLLPKYSERSIVHMIRDLEQVSTRYLTKSTPTRRMERTIALGIAWFLALTVLVPHVVIHGISIGIDDISAAFILLFLTGYILQKPNNPFCRLSGLPITILWAAIIITGIVFSIFGGLFYLNKFHPPTEMWQYVKRMAFFYFVCYLSYRSIISSRSFHSCLQNVLILAFLIGILQVLPGHIGDYLAGLYARTEGQLSLTEKSFAVSRNYGVAGSATAWGGFSMFGAAVSLGGLLANSERRIKRSSSRIRLWIILGLAIVNVMFSGSRVAMAAILAVYVIFIVISFFRTRSKFRLFITYISGSVLVCIGFVYMFWDKVLFIIYRFGVLIDQSGGARIDQVREAVSLLLDAQSWIFGVGNATQRTLATSFGTEVEPVFLLVNYGILGVALRYGLLLVIFIYACRQLKRAAQNDLGLTIATVLALSGYAVFSLGYFFYHELHVGMMPWLLFGWVVGSYYRYRRLTFDGSYISIPSTSREDS